MVDAPTPDWDRGYVQVYTGDGKGKTTAALGLALRAIGAGLNVFIGQFVKGMPYSEVKAAESFGNRMELRLFGRGCLLDRKPEAADIDAARRGLEVVRRVFRAGRHRLVILDEANIATHLKLITVDDLLAVIDARPENVELILTGRHADPRVLERADLVTEMRKVKHYYSDGVAAREGIER